MADSYDPAIHHRRSIRLKGYDYATAGAYFLTLCAQGQHHLFGEIVGGDMLLNELGDIVTEEWARTPDVRREVVLDAYVVMPNHLHGVLLIDRAKMRAAVPRTGRMPYGRMPYAPTLRSPTQTAGSIVRGFKAAVTHRVGALCGTPNVRVWQRNYYEHVIRDDGDLDSIRAYIANNPLRWAEDDYNTEDRP
jgi:putative transposase